MHMLRDSVLLVVIGTCLVTDTLRRPPTCWARAAMIRGLKFPHVAITCCFLRFIDTHAVAVGWIDTNKFCRASVELGNIIKAVGSTGHRFVFTYFRTCGHSSSSSPSSAVHRISVIFCCLLLHVGFSFDRFIKYTRVLFTQPLLGRYHASLIDAVLPVFTHAVVTISITLASAVAIP